MQKVNSKDNISNFEIFAYGITPLAGLGAMLCNTFLTAFWTDTIGISATIVGLILLGSRVFDGVSDLIIGGVIDKTHTRYGKAKPWFLVGALGSLVLSVLAFAVPDIGMQGKIIYSTIIYILLVCIFGTMSSVASPALANLVTMDQNKRFTLGSVNFVIMFGTIILVSFGINFVDTLGGGQKGWINLSIVCGMISIIFILISWFGIKEHCGQEKVIRDKVGVLETLKTILSNKYFLAVTAMYFATNVYNGITTGVGFYYAVYIFRNPAAFTVLITAAFLPCMIGTALAPIITKRFGVSRVVVLGNIIMIASYILMFISPRNLVFVIVCTAVGTFASGPACAVLLPYCTMAADYGEYKTGVARPGIYSGGASVGTKIGIGVGGAILGLVLGASGYDGLAEVQTITAENAIMGCYILAPAIAVSIITLLCIPFFKLEKEHSHIVEVNIERRKKEEEAEE